MKYVYPVIFTEEDGKVLAHAPDLPHVYTFGDDMADAMFMAEDAVAMWLDNAEEHNIAIPEPSPVKTVEGTISDGVVSLIACDTDEYRRGISKKAVIKSVSIPEWLDFRARRADAPLSSILQKGLKEYLRIAD